jgi:excisionase family DNA binding protein
VAILVNVWLLVTQIDQCAILNMATCQFLTCYSGERTVPVKMPDERKLPPGPWRELTQALYALYESAGKPGTREISEAIKNRDDLRDVVSHEGVRNILGGKHARWSKIECVVVQLANWSVGRPNPVAELERIHRLWSAAEGSETAADARQEEVMPTVGSADTGEPNSEVQQKLLAPGDPSGDRPSVSRRDGQESLIIRNPRAGATTDDDSGFLTVAEIAEIVRVSKMTVYRLIRSHDLDATRVGRSLRVTRQAIREYLETHSLTKYPPDETRGHN